MTNKFFTGLLILLILFCFSFVFGSQEIKAADITYIVKPGDSLYFISREYNVTIQTIKESNNLQTDIIYINQILTIPVVDDGYLVKPGDSLYKLAIRYNTSIQRIKELNNLQSDIIYIGQRLRMGSAVNSYISVSGNAKISNKTANLKMTDLQEVINTEMVSSLSVVNNETSEYQEAEVIVKYKPLITGQAVNEIEKKNGLSTMNVLENSKGKVVRYKIPEDKEVEDVMNHYQKLEQVEWVEPNYIYYPADIPTDAYYNYHQWNLVNLNLEAAWDIVKGSNSITVAVLDTGVMTNHPDLRANLISGVDFVGGEKNYPVSNYNITDYDPTDETPLIEGGSHGTHVAGIIGAVTDNYKGVAGVNWNVNLLPIRVLRRKGGTSWDIAEGIYYAIDRNARVINLSLGGNSYSHLQDEAIKEAYSKGIVTIAAAGNEGSEVYYPAVLPETIAVGAVTKNNTVTYYSNHGPEIDVVAPGGIHGESIYSTWGYYDQGDEISSYGGMIGTSMATPHVSGAAALLLASGVEGPENIRTRLLSTARDLGNTGKDNYYGYGLIDVYGALQNQKISNPEVFAINKEEGIYNLESDVKMADEDGAFKLEKVKKGEVNIIAWLDVNENNVIDKGDYYGETDRLNIINLKTDVEITLNYIANSTFQIKVQREE